MEKNVYELIEPIELKGKEPLEKLVFHKPTLGELTKVKAEGNYAKGLQMLAACCDQPEPILKRLSYDDTNELMENFLPDFLGIEE
jgi:hypothetical protein